MNTPDENITYITVEPVKEDSAQGIDLLQKGLLQEVYSSSCAPTKKPRQAKLDKVERQHNRLLARLRVIAEHVNRRLKIFRILAERYRNRRRRFGIIVNLIAAIINFELALTC